MAAIEPFRRFIVYPAAMRGVAQIWELRYAKRGRVQAESGA